MNKWCERKYYGRSRHRFLSETGVKAVSGDFYEAIRDADFSTTNLEYPITLSDKNRSKGYVWANFYCAQVI